VKSQAWSITISNTLTIVEEPTDKIDEARMAQLAKTGSISVRVCRAVIRKENPSGHIRQEMSFDKQSDIPEKAMKGRALTHGAGYDARALPHSTKY